MVVVVDREQLHTIEEAGQQQPPDPETRIAPLSPPGGDNTERPESEDSNGPITVDSDDDIFSFSTLSPLHTLPPSKDDDIDVKGVINFDTQ